MNFVSFKYLNVYVHIYSSVHLDISFNLLSCSGRSVWRSWRLYGAWRYGLLGSWVITGLAQTKREDFAEGWQKCSIFVVVVVMVVVVVAFDKKIRNRKSACWMKTMDKTSTSLVHASWIPSNSLRRSPEFKSFDCSLLGSPTLFRTSSR
jgi:hypothetical protein